ncbi:MAG: DUF4249 domain-containing protein [Chitinophagaceae bacterium]|nr:DUF4249 domain-containing protein [Chitinophagaceae bacterium]
MSHKLFFIPAIIILLSSCQKVIDVDLNSASPAYVIEANLYEGTHDFHVKVTKTTSYFSSDAPPTVNDATITLIDQNNVSHAVPNTGNGIYTLPAFTAVNNVSYQLNVSAGGKTFSATAKMPLPTSIDSLTYEEFGGFGGGPGGGGGGEKNFLVVTHFQDTVGIPNYYRVLVTKNDTLLNKPFDYYLVDDKIRDGQYFDAPLFTAFSKMGDTLDVELLSMDAGVFDYFNTLSEILTSDANTSAAPANPNTNFNNGALGYFGAFTRSKKSIRIK